jgi:hypothetical protein
MSYETWRPIQKYLGLIEASDCGNIRTVDRYISGRDYVGRILSQRLHKGYMRVNINFYGISRSEPVHRLVMLAFVGPSDLTVDHINGVKTDNRLVNLEYVTTEENTRRYKRNRPLPTGVTKSKNGKFQARICIEGLDYHLGTFESQEKAHSAYLEVLSNPSCVNKVIAESKVRAKGIYQDRNRFVVVVRWSNRSIKLGTFKSVEEASVILEKWNQEKVT